MRAFLITALACSILFSPRVSFCQEEGVPAEQKTITLDVKDMELADVLRMIADQSGLNIITSKNVRGQVTINMQDLPVDKVLDVILKVNNCGFVREGNILQVYTYQELSQREQFSQLVTKVYRLDHVKAMDLKQTITSLKSVRGRIEVEPRTNTIVVTDTEESVRSIGEAIKEMDKKLETKVYRLNYADPIELQKTLQGIIPPTEGDFLIDPRTNGLVVTASPLLLNKIDALVTNWDKRIPQVLIEAKIMQLTLDKDRFLGIDWQFKDANKHSITVGASGLPIPTGVAVVDAFKIGLLTADEFQVTIKALDQFSDVNLISSPSIVTLDNAEAKILIGSSEPYEVFHFDQFGNINSKEIKFVEVGIKLVVTPSISDDGFITMNIRPEVSSARIGTATNALAIDTTEANTIMTVKDGNTVVLGGLIKDDREEHIAKIPLLGDIPLLKYLFRNKYYTTVKKEIIIFITPRIVNPDKLSERTQIVTDKKDLEIEKALERLSGKEKAY